MFIITTEFHVQSKSRKAGSRNYLCLISDMLKLTWWHWALLILTSSGDFKIYFLMHVFLSVHLQFTVNLERGQNENRELGESLIWSPIYHMCRPSKCSDVGGSCTPSSVFLAKKIHPVPHRHAVVVQVWSHRRLANIFLYNSKWMPSCFKICSLYENVLYVKNTSRIQ